MTKISDNGINWDIEASRALSDPPIPTDENTISWFRSNFSLPDSGLVLDFGCCIGKWIPLWLALGFEPIGIDQSRFALKLAKTRNPETEFVRCMCQDLPFRINCFDIVISTAVFQHNNNKTKTRFLREIKCLLKKSGLFLITESTQEGVDENWTNDRFFSKIGWIKFISLHGFEFLCHVNPNNWYLFRRGNA